MNYWGNHQPSTINNNREMIIVDNSWNLHVFEIINHYHLPCHTVSEAIESRIPHAKRMRSEAMAGHPAIPRPSAGDTFPGQIHEWYAGWGPPVISWFTNPLGIPLSFISPANQVTSHLPPVISFQIVLGRKTKTLILQWTVNSTTWSTTDIPLTRSRP